MVAVCLLPANSGARTPHNFVLRTLACPAPGQRVQAFRGMTCRSKQLTNLKKVSAAQPEADANDPWPQWSVIHSDIPLHPPTSPLPTSITQMGFFSNSSNRAAKQTSVPNPLIGAYTHLSSMQRADEALKILYQLASFVKPIMQKRNWKVGTLAEFLPDYHALQGSSLLPVYFS